MDQKESIDATTKTIQILFTSFQAGNKKKVVFQLSATEKIAAFIVTDW